MNHVLDQRAHERRAYDVEQFAAIYPAGDDLDRLKSQKVLCRDLSAAEFSFWNARAANFGHVVLRLALSECAAQILSELRHVTRTADSRYLIGCKFLRRLAGPQ